MHAEVTQFIQEQIPLIGPVERVVEFGSRDINGSVRHLFEASEYLGIDLHSGPGVDLVADAALWDGQGAWDVVVCCEVLEHVAEWALLLLSARRALCSGGTLLVTCATGTRAPHSMHREGPPDPEEHYENIDPDALTKVLGNFFSVVSSRVARGGEDLQVVAQT